MLRRMGWIALLPLALASPLRGGEAPEPMVDITIRGSSYPCFMEFSGRELNGLEIDQNGEGYRCRYDGGAYYYSLNPLVVGPNRGQGAGGSAETAGGEGPFHLTDLAQASLPFLVGLIPGAGGVVLIRRSEPPRPEVRPSRRKGGRASHLRQPSRQLHRG